MSIKRLVSFLVVLTLVSLVPASLAFAVDSGKLAAGTPVIDKPEGSQVAVGTQAASEGSRVVVGTQAAKVTKKDKTAAIKVVKKYLKAAKSYNTDAMSACFKNKKKARSNFFSSNKQLKFLVKYAKKYNKRIKYKSFTVSETENGLKVTAIITRPNAFSPYWTGFELFEAKVYNYVSKYGKSPSKKTSNKYLAASLKKAMKHSYIDVYDDWDDDSYYDDGYGVDIITARYDFTLKKSGKRWCLSDKVDSYEFGFDEPSDEPDQMSIYDLANMNFEYCANSYTDND